MITITAIVTNVGTTRTFDSNKSIVGEGKARDVVMRASGAEFCAEAYDEVVDKMDKEHLAPGDVVSADLRLGMREWKSEKGQGVSPRIRLMNYTLLAKGTNHYDGF